MDARKSISRAGWRGGPSLWISPHPNQYVPPHINNRYVNSFLKSVPNGHWWLYPTAMAAQPSMAIFTRAEKPSDDITRRLFVTNMKGLRVPFYCVCWRQVVTNYMFAYKQFVPRKSLQFSCTLFIRFWAWEDISSKIFSLCLLKGSLPRDFRLPVFS